MIDYSDIDKMSKAELDEFISFASTQKHKADKKQTDTYLSIIRNFHNRLNN